MIQHLRRRHVVRALAALVQSLRLSGRPEEADEGDRKLHRVHDHLVHRAEESNDLADPLVLELRPQDSRRVQKLHRLVQTDPLVSLGDAGLVAGLCRALSRDGIDQGGFSHIRDAGDHGPERPVQDPPLLVPLPFLCADTLDQDHQPLQILLAPPVHEKAVISGSLEIFHPLVGYRFLREVRLV